MYQVHATIQDPAADIVIVCPLQKDGPPHTAFKVSKRRLTSQSSIFQDMLEPLPPKTEDPSEDLPVIHLGESVEALEILLAAVYNLPQGLRKLDHFDWHPTLEVWEAANKYEMYTTRALASKCLITQIPQRNHYKDILDIHLKATASDDPDLATAALERFTDCEVSYGRSNDNLPWQGKNLVMGMTQKNRLQAILSRSEKRLEKFPEHDTAVNSLLKKYMPKKDYEQIVPTLNIQRSAERARLVTDLERLCGASYST